MSQQTKYKKIRRFSTSWARTDVVLVVENQKLHVHRSVLASCSPVFENIFTTSNAEEIFLHGKKADEVREMLYVIYPHLSKIVCACSNLRTNIRLKICRKDARSS